MVTPFTEKRKRVRTIQVATREAGTGLDIILNDVLEVPETLNTGYRIRRGGRSYKLHGNCLVKNGQWRWKAESYTL